jgi:L-lactate dehydrogenase complex protein LldG
VSGREEMLERIRRALGSSAKGPALSSPAHGLQELPPEEEPVLPPIAPENLVPRFEEELRTVGGVAYRASTRSELEEVTRAIFTACGATAAVLSRNPLLARLGLADRLRVCGISVALWPAPEPLSQTHLAPREFGLSQSATQGATTEAAFREQSFAAAIGVTGVDFALAESGTMVVSSMTEGSQLASLAPPVHLALYTRAQVLGSLEEVLERVSPSSNPGRSVVLITGTSRTADIEQILIRGVHGPREVHAILVEDSCLVE